MSPEQEQESGRIIPVNLTKEMEQSFLDYSMSVIVQRALPDVRDGLKPVHRRILYTMFENTLWPEKPYRKCADTVGAVLGRYHPHGDASVYDAMVRLAQDFSMRYMLVDGHGNFGSVDGDPPAAYRYTEAKMNKLSVAMLDDIDKDTVDFNPNYDDRLKEPAVLPSHFPNILVNGSTGIAVGMATNIPPHNMGEVIDGVCCLIDNPEATLEDLMEHIKGPDFPTGGIVMGRSGIRAAYATGRGKIAVRARAEIEENEKTGRSKIIVTELPYQVNKARLIESIADLVKEKRIDGISNVDDHSDRNGMHIVIDVKRDAAPQIVLNHLYTLTQLQITFGVIMLAIVNGRPEVLNLRKILEEYISFQMEVITRRTRYDLKKAQDRAHILEGLMVALDFIDEVVSILRHSKSIPEGKAALMERFDLDDPQTQAIVQMPLGRLTGLEREKIEEELKALKEKIADFLEILQSEARRLAIVKDEAQSMKKRFADERRTEIAAISGEVDIEDLIPVEECVLTMTNYGYVKRQKMDTYRTQKRGGRGVAGMNRRDEDVATELFVTGSHDYVLFFSSLGRVYRLKCYEIPEGSRVSRGMNIKNLLPLQGDEKITSMIRVESFDEDKYLVMVTKCGVVKRTKLSAYDTARKAGLIAIDLDEGDSLSWVRVTSGSDQLLVATKKGMALRFAETDVRELSRLARGVRVMQLKDGDCIVGMAVLREGAYVLTVTETGFGRLSSPDNYRIQKRGGKGLLNYHVDRFGDVASIRVVDLEDDVILISEDGVIIRIMASSIRVCARPSKGVRVMKLQEGSRVATLARAPHEEGEATDEVEDDGSAEEGAEEAGQQEE
ncbi:DNA gyrase subunit A [Neglecta sp. X4]|uniref:DNA gyrase subunit A n=1 Tax=unclassified Neglectibacter TaxID=2632164 RepID=UPI00136E2587|nr:DNA gyrase subunit A [Neglectibacter sp. 59]NBJ73525.1 DNA gyrase subunit A [Neglectibacter sp. X4]NCE81270.1 DNA gyrase subunit A [Neglectibacter sp. X58]